MIMHSDCPFHLFPHVVGNRSCLVLLCHVQREAWVEVSTKSRPKFSQRKVNNNYAKHKTLVFRTQTAPLGDPQHAFSTLFRAFSESVWTCLLISTCVMKASKTHNTMNECHWCCMLLIWQPSLGSLTSLLGGEGPAFFPKTFLPPLLIGGPFHLAITGDRGNRS